MSVLATCKAQDVDKVLALLAAGADARACGWDGQTALHFAARHGLTSLVEPLLAAGAQLEAWDGRVEATPFLDACAAGHEGMALTLLAAGADARAVDNLGETALHLAAAKGLASLVARLLAVGVDLEAKDTFFDMTALAKACVIGHEAMALALLAAGADACAVDSTQRTTLHFAAQRGLASLWRRWWQQVLD